MLSQLFYLLAHLPMGLHSSLSLHLFILISSYPVAAYLPTPSAYPIFTLALLQGWAHPTLSTSLPPFLAIARMGPIHHLLL